MRYLAIDRILSKDKLILSGERLNSVLKNRISDRGELTVEESEKIDRLTTDLHKEEVFRLVSVLTPFEAATPIEFDMVFDHEDLQTTERCHLILNHILYLKNNYLTELPRGHHCEIFVECRGHTPQLFQKLPIGQYDTVKLGICNHEDWPAIKTQLEESNRITEAWKRSNPQAFLKK